MAVKHGRCRRNAFSSGINLRNFNVKIRFLQIVNRSVGKTSTSVLVNFRNGRAGFEFQVVDRLEVGGQTFVPWQEAMEREMVRSATASGGRLVARRR